MPEIPATADDEYAISLAQTGYRDAINSGDVDAAMATIAASFTWMRDGEPSYWGKEGNRALRQWVERTVEKHCRISIIPDQTQLFGTNAVSRGWETLEISDANGGMQKTRFRYFQTWEKSEDGRWRMTSFISNKDVTPAMLED